MTERRKGARPYRNRGMGLEAYKQWFTDHLEANGDCLLWTMGTVNGYGWLKDMEGKPTRAHREAWRLEFGYMPKQLNHKCDVRACCNTDHLYEGTPQENTRDMVKRDRHCRGERSPFNKLTDETVAEIRIRRKAGETTASLARKFGIEQTTVWGAATGRAWKHVKETPATPQRYARLATEQKVAVWLLLEAGVPGPLLGQLVGVTKAAIYKNRRTMRKTLFPE